MVPTTPAMASVLRRAWALALGALACILAGPFLLLPTRLARVAETWAAVLFLALWLLAVALVIGRLLWSTTAVFTWLERRLRRWVALFAADPAGLWLHWTRRAHRSEMAHWCLQQAVAAGGAEAQFQYGLIFLEGGFGPSGQAAAVAWFRRAADQGHTEAAFRLAEVLRTGAGQVLQDRAGSESWYLRSAGSGYGPAAAWLAHAYGMGDGVSVDEGRARRWAEQAERLRPHPELSRSVLRHDAAPEDPLVRLAARTAQGVEFLAARGVEYRAGRWSLLMGALLLGVVLLGTLGWLFWAGSSSLFHLPLLMAASLLLLLGWQTRQLRADRPRSGRDRLLEAAEAGDPEACHRLGLAYRQGSPGRPRDDLSAALWFRKAADQGHREAMLALAEAYLGGHGVLRDPREAARWAEAAGRESTS